MMEVHTWGLLGKYDFCATTSDYTGQVSEQIAFDLLFARDNFDCDVIRCMIFAKSTMLTLQDV
jgi:hypothetical protein